MPVASLISLLVYFILMLVIGWLVRQRSSAGPAAFLLGGRQLGPGVTALSAGASDMSAWIMMGLPGAMVLNGFSSSWIAAGLVLGAWCNYHLVAPRLRIYTELCNDALTLPDFFSQRFADQRQILGIAAACVFIVFFTLYTASGLVAGGVLFESSFGLDYELGLGITLGVVLIYTLLGGFQAVCLTDFVQGCLMLAALLLLPLIAFVELDGLANAGNLVQEYQPDFMDWLRGLGALALVSNLAWGLGYFGQPHIIVRFMAIRSASDLPLARRIGIGWMSAALAGSLLTGFFGLALLLQRGLTLDNPETIFIVLSQLLFHPLISGLLLAAILAAIMSTVSSQLLVASSSLAQDCYFVMRKQQLEGSGAVLANRLAVVMVAVLAAVIAAGRSNSILALVSNAWAGFGAAFGPLVLMSLFWRQMNWQGALAGMLTGATVVLLWIYLPLAPGGRSLSTLIYEIVPGFLCSLAAIVVVSKLTAKPGTQVQNRFDQMLRELVQHTA